MYTTNFVISFSGASHSGKTTYMNLIKDHYKDNCVIIDEPIRKKNIISIDEIRKDIPKYFTLQKEVFYERIKLENSLEENYDNKIILIDRSLIDSIFYFLFYLDKSTMSQEMIKEYTDFYQIARKEIFKSFINRYDLVLLFKPIDASNNLDPMRPKNIIGLQELERVQIYGLTREFEAEIKDPINDGGCAKIKYNFDGKNTDISIFIRNYIIANCSESFFKENKWLYI